MYMVTTEARISSSVFDSEASQASAELTRLAEQQRRLVNQFRV